MSGGPRRPRLQLSKLLALLVGKALVPGLLLNRALSILGDPLQFLLPLLGFLLSDRSTRGSQPPPDGARVSQRGPLSNPGPVGVRARAPEEPIEVAVGNPGPQRAAENAEEDVEERVGQGVVYMYTH